MSFPGNICVRGYDISGAAGGEGPFGGRLPRESLGEALDALEADHDYLTQGGVFPPRLLEIWIEKKRAELEEIDRQPTPAEFAMYYGL